MPVVTTQYPATARPPRMTLRSHFPSVIIPSQMIAPTKMNGSSITRYGSTAAWTNPIGEAAASLRPAAIRRKAVAMRYFQRPSISAPPSPCRP